jgi:hypothetical protein
LLALKGGKMFFLCEQKEAEKLCALGPPLLALCVFMF